MPAIRLRYLAAPALAGAVLFALHEAQGADGGGLESRPAPERGLIRSDALPSIDGPRADAVEPIARGAAAAVERSNAASGGEALAEPHALREAAEDVAEQVDLAIDGIVEVNRVVEQMIQIADAPVDPQVDYESSSDGTISHRLCDLPEGFQGHFRIDPEQTLPDGTTYNSLRLVLENPDETKALVHGAPRYGPSVEATVTYNSDGQTLARVGLMMKNEMNFRSSLERGVNPDVGEFASGSHYVLDLTRGGRVITTTLGYRDGHVTSTIGDPKYQLGPAQVTGDLKLKRGAADALLQKLLAKKAGLIARRDQ